MNYGTVDRLSHGVGSAIAENRRPYRLHCRIISIVSFTLIGLIAASFLLSMEEAQRPTFLYGWVKDSDSTDTSTINAEEVEQLDSLLNAQDELKKNIRVKPEKPMP